MITIYRTIAGEWRLLDSFEKDTWIHVSDPTEEEKELLQQFFGIPRGLIRDSLDEDERARVKKLDHFVFLVLRCSDSRGEGDIPFATTPLGIFLFEDYLLTICKTNPDVITEIIEGRGEDLRTDERTTFLLKLFFMTENIYALQLREINEKSTLHEKKLKTSLNTQKLEELVNYGKSLIYFSAAIKTNEEMLENLEHSNYIPLKPENLDILEDVRLQNKENADVADIYFNIHDGLMDAFSSVTSVNLSSLVRILTEITIALSLPMIVTGLWGMNVGLPLKEYPVMFWVLIGMMIALVVAAFLTMRYLELLGPHGPL